MSKELFFPEKEGRAVWRPTLSSLPFLDLTMLWRAGGPPFLPCFFSSLTILRVPYPLPEKPRGFCNSEGKGRLKNQHRSKPATRKIERFRGLALSRCTISQLNFQMLLAKLNASADVRTIFENRIAASKLGN